MSAAVFKATFSDWRTVKGRKQLQIILEAPLEKQAEILKVLGAPNPSNPAWVAVALLDPEKVKEQAPEARSSSSPTDNRNEEPPANAGLKRKWNELSYAEQAGIRVNDPEFKRYLEASLPTVLAELGGDHVELIRHICGVKSRAEILPGTPAAERWRRLDADFRGLDR